MRSGKLDQEIYFERLDQVNDRGETRDVFSPVDLSTDSPAEALPVAAYILSQRGSEAFEAARTQSTKTIRVLIRYRDDVRNDWRVKWNDEFYNISEIDRSLRRKGELWFTATGKGGA